MQRKGGKPPHSLTEYFYIIPNEWANKSNRKCICRACMDAVGRDFALQDDSMKITNTKRYCANHLRDCSYFATKYSPEQIQLILGSVTPSTPNKRTLVTKDDAASDNDLKLLADIKVTINRDSFWDSLTTLHKILHPFCDIILWWSHNSGAAPELSRVACQLFGICITTASVERLFSTMGFLHSPLRNKLKDKKVVAMSQLHQVFEETDIDDINEENEEITSEISWNSAINEWEELLIDEEFEEDPDDLDNADMDFLDLEIHPAENQAAKWKLHDLFLSDLPFPFE
ncbi:6553_t:CDS:2 [Dentiscutata erythropus]|uniref:6553_t:CDS:1 n=1 Tax=Dentiscutata erythropus TaxID=1348616 RepID=A0A9N8WFD8_9GLOM|nr:6553_t:CDS:2 [Dentiscutata erythropus]